MNEYESLLTELEVKYPFSPTSRRIFERISFDEFLESSEVIRHTEERILCSIKGQAYQQHLSYLIEFVSFFTSAFVASRDSFITTKFSRQEASRATEKFRYETAESKQSLLQAFYNAVITKKTENEFTIPVENYLKVGSRYGLFRLQRWKLGRRNVSNGIVFLEENDVNDLFRDCAVSLITEGVMNLRKTTFPVQLRPVWERISRLIPAKKARRSGIYQYIEELLKYPVTDGRHRLVWLVLAPYLINVKKVEDYEAIQIITNYVTATGGSSDMKRFIEYNVRRVRRNGLMPPTFETLKNEHPDLFMLLPEQVKSKE